MSQATRQLAVTPPPSGGITNPLTMPCQGGGSMVITLGPMEPPQDNVFRTSSRIEYRDCRNQTVTINGDPYLESSGEFLLPTPGGTGEATSTTTRHAFRQRRRRGVRFSMRLTPEVSMTATGTTTFEQPLGSTPVVRPCGPA